MAIARRDTPQFVQFSLYPELDRGRNRLFRPCAFFDNLSRKYSYHFLKGDASAGLSVDLLLCDPSLRRAQIVFHTSGPLEYAYVDASHR